MAFTEFFTNRGSCTLTAGYTAGAGSITVSSTTGDDVNFPFPVTAPFRLSLWTASSQTFKVLLKVTAITDGTHFAVTAEGTDANAANGDTCYGVITADALTAIRTDAGTDANLTLTDITTNNVSTSKHGFAPKAPNDATKFLDGTGAYSVPSGGSPSSTVLAPVAYASIAAAGTAGRLYPWLTTSPYVLRDNGASWDATVPGFGSVTIPPTASWTWDNQGSSTISFTNGYGYLYSPANGGTTNSARVQYRTAPATPYTVTALISASTFDANGGYNAYGLFFRDDSGKLMGYYVLVDPTAGPELNRNHWASSTSYTGSDTLWSGYSSFNGILKQALWLQMTDNGTNLLFNFSVDGQNWLQFASASRTAHFASGPTQIGFGCNPINNQCQLMLLSWAIT